MRIFHSLPVTVYVIGEQEIHVFFCAYYSSIPDKPALKRRMEEPGTPEAPVRKRGRPKKNPELSRQVSVSGTPVSSSVNRQVLELLFCAA